MDETWNYGKEGPQNLVVPSIHKPPSCLYNYSIKKPKANIELAFGLLTMTIAI